MLRSLLGHIRSNAVGYAAILLVVTLAPTSAYATHLMVRSSDIVDGQVKNPDIALDAVTSGRIKNGQVGRSDLASSSVDSSKVADGTIGGADIDESTLTQVPTALQGGLGRYGFSGSCDPETTTFVPCSTVQITLDKPGRLLVIGAVNGQTEHDSDRAMGECRIGTTNGPVLASKSTIDLDDDGNLDNLLESMTLLAVTGVFPAGTHSVGVDCNQQDWGAIWYSQARVTAVALSAG